MPTEEQTYRDGIQVHLQTQDIKLDKILEQTTKTNGRVTNLETEKAIQDAQFRLIKGMLYAVGAAVTFLVGDIAIPLVSSLIQAGRI